MLTVARIALAWLLFVGLAHADGTFGVGADGMTFAVGNGIGKKGSGGGGPTNSLTFTGPSSGIVSVPSTNFTVSIGSGSFNGSQTVTIADGSQGGKFTPSVGSPGTSTVTVTPTNGATSFTLTYTPAVAATITLTVTNAQSWTNPSPLTYASSLYVAQGVLFASSSIGAKTGALTGATNGATGLISLWLKDTSATGTQKTVFTLYTSATNYFSLFISSSTGKLVITGATVTPTTILTMQSGGSLASASTWSNIILSWNLSTGRGQIYVNDVSSLTASPTLTSGNINYAATAPGLASANGTAFLNTNIADYQMWFGVDVDISVTANRRPFIDGSGNAVSPVAAVAAYGTPIVALSGALGTGGATWATNKGSGGGFTLGGASLTAAADNPP